MGILGAALPTIIVCTRDRDRSTAFYRDVLGLELAFEDRYAAVFRTGGVNLRVSTVSDFTPHGHTIVGFKVRDVTAAVKALGEKGVVFGIHEGFAQDELGILSMLDGTLQVAWFKDPDGNVLSVTNV